MYEESTSCVQVGHIARISDIGIRIFLPPWAKCSFVEFVLYTRLHFHNTKLWPMSRRKPKLWPNLETLAKIFQFRRL